MFIELSFVVSGLPIRLSVLFIVVQKSSVGLIHFLKLPDFFLLLQPFVALALLPQPFGVLVLHILSP